MNQIQTHKPYFPKIHFNIILPSILRSSEWSLPLRFSNQNFYAFLISPYALRAPPTSSSLICLRNIWWRVQIVELLIMQFSLASCHLISLRSKYFPKHPSIEIHKQTNVAFIFWTTIYADVVKLGHYLVLISPLKITCQLLWRRVDGAVWSWGNGTALASREPLLVAESSHARGSVKCAPTGQHIERRQTVPFPNILAAHLVQERISSE
jgi:hypothetical protein